MVYFRYIKNCIFEGDICEIIEDNTIELVDGDILITDIEKDGGDAYVYYLSELRDIEDLNSITNDQKDNIMKKCKINLKESIKQEYLNKKKRLEENYKKFLLSM